MGGGGGGEWLLVDRVVERDGSENIVKDDISRREDTNQKLKNKLQKDSPSSVKAEKIKARVFCW